MIRESIFCSPLSFLILRRMIGDPMLFDEVQPLLEEGCIAKKIVKNREVYIFLRNGLVYEKILGSLLVDRYFFTDGDFDEDIWIVIKNPEYRFVEGFEFLQESEN